VSFGPYGLKLLNFAQRPRIHAEHRSRRNWLPPGPSLGTLLPSELLRCLSRVMGSSKQRRISELALRHHVLPVSDRGSGVDSDALTVRASAASRWLGRLDRH